MDYSRRPEPSVRTGGVGRGVGRGNGASTNSDFGVQPGLSSTSKNNANASNHFRGGSSGTPGPTGMPAELLRKFTMLKSYKPYLLRRQQDIHKAGRNRELHEELDDIDFVLQNMCVTIFESCGESTVDAAIDIALRIARENPIHDLDDNEDEVNLSQDPNPHSQGMLTTNFASVHSANDPAPQPDYSQPYSLAGNSHGQFSEPRHEFRDESRHRRADNDRRPREYERRSSGQRHPSNDRSGQSRERRKESSGHYQHNLPNVTSGTERHGQDYYRRGDPEPINWSDPNRYPNAHNDSRYPEFERRRRPSTDHRSSRSHGSFQAEVRAPGDPIYDAHQTRDPSRIQTQFQTNPSANEIRSPSYHAHNVPPGNPNQFAQPPSNQNANFQFDRRPGPGPIPSVDHGFSGAPDYFEAEIRSPVAPANDAHFNTQTQFHTEPEPDPTQFHTEPEPDPYGQSYGVPLGLGSHGHQHTNVSDLRTQAPGIPPDMHTRGIIRSESYQPDMRSNQDHLRSPTSEFHRRELPRSHSYDSPHSQHPSAIPQNHPSPNQIQHSPAQVIRPAVPPVTAVPAQVQHPVQHTRDHIKNRNENRHPPTQSLRPRIPENTIHQNPVRHPQHAAQHQQPPPQFPPFRTTAIAPGVNATRLGSPQTQPQPTPEDVMRRAKEYFSQRGRGGHRPGAPHRGGIRPTGTGYHARPDRPAANNRPGMSTTAKPPRVKYNEPLRRPVQPETSLSSNQIPATPRNTLPVSKSNASSSNASIKAVAVQESLAEKRLRTSNALAAEEEKRQRPNKLLDFKKSLRATASNLVILGPSSMRTSIENSASVVIPESELQSAAKVASAATHNAAAQNSANPDPESESESSDSKNSDSEPEVKNKSKSSRAITNQTKNVVKLQIASKSMSSKSKSKASSTESSTSPQSVSQSPSVSDDSDKDYQPVQSKKQKSKKKPSPSKSRSKSKPEPKSRSKASSKDSVGKSSKATKEADKTKARKTKSPAESSRVHSPSTSNSKKSTASKLKSQPNSSRAHSSAKENTVNTPKPPAKSASSSKNSEKFKSSDKTKTNKNRVSPKKPVAETSDSDDDEPIKRPQNKRKKNVIVSDGESSSEIEIIEIPYKKIARSTGNQLPNINSSVEPSTNTQSIDILNNSNIRISVITHNAVPPEENTHRNIDKPMQTQQNYSANAMTRNNLPKISEINSEQPSTSKTAISSANKPSVTNTSCSNSKKSSNSKSGTPGSQNTQNVPSNLQSDTDSNEPPLPITNEYGEYIVRREKRTKIPFPVGPTIHPGNPRKSNIIGPRDLVVNNGLDKVKLESDYIPPVAVKPEPLDTRVHLPTLTPSADSGIVEEDELEKQMEELFGQDIDDNAFEIETNNVVLEEIDISDGEMDDYN